MLKQKMICGRAQKAQTQTPTNQNPHKIKIADESLQIRRKVTFRCLTTIRLEAIAVTRNCKRYSQALQIIPRPRAIFRRATVTETDGGLTVTRLLWFIRPCKSLKTSTILIKALLRARYSQSSTFRLWEDL